MSLVNIWYICRNLNMVISTKRNPFVETSIVKKSCLRKDGNFFHDSWAPYFFSQHLTRVSVNYGLVSLLNPWQKKIHFYWSTFPHPNKLYLRNLFSV